MKNRRCNMIKNVSRFSVGYALMLLQKSEAQFFVLLFELWSSKVFEQYTCAYYHWQLNWTRSRFHNILVIL